jgi:hypothetical protein
MFKRTSTPSKTNFNSIENCSILLQSKRKSIWLQTDPIEKCTKSTNTPNYFDDMLNQGKNMNDSEFENFIQGKKKVLGFILIIFQLK